MALGPRLDLRQSQSLVMTPQLQQAIRLLALSNIEIEAFIGEELERNPLLELGGEEPGSDIGMSGVDAVFDAPPAPASGGDPAGSDELIGAGMGETDRPLDMDLNGEVFHHDSVSDCPERIAGEASGGLDGALSLNDIATGGSGGDSDGWEDSLEYDLSLREHLHAQAGIVLSGTALFIGRHLIELIDENGYLRGDLLQVSHQLGVPLGEVEAALAVVQTLEPTGVGARDLAECLALQAKEADRYDPCMARLIDNLELLARGALPQLKRLCRVDDEDLADMIAELRQYDPKPGSRFGGSSIEAVVPDLFVIEREGKWLIEINSATLPRLLVNRSYHVSLTGGRHDAKSKAWLSECLAEANWLVKALDQRQRTIIKVASEIVKQQEAFFRHGVTQLRPLTLRSVADAIEMHESTVSRVTSHKYLSCARGLYELKYFFTSAIQATDGGDAVSASAVKSHIKALIDEEDAKNILSDDQLVDLLKERGFDIARRTVAKYREALGLGSSVQRRRQKKLQGAR
ncbi:RNA polymerase factor sigma-54 [Blastomonas sp. AAP53]|uniref:RNA polymerase factor sigma-54 n=1 Tax=Blastomonas sp. AAP53 TaxID=1248760 RepID=UPI0002DF0999|nr:RNA polymerase factor sigma-54 [Blastomonas sp. AAP53]